MGNMYEGTKTWNPFVGCEFDCIYCKPSFQAILRVYGKCVKCKAYEPHFHEERLLKIPNYPIIFVAGTGDLSFATYEQMMNIIRTVNKDSRKHPDRLYYYQSKNPIIFEPFLDELNPQSILVTTLETNRGQGYEKVSKAIAPPERWRDFMSLDYPRKIITIEPILDFDVEPFYRNIEAVNPEKIYIGYNSKPTRVRLEEPHPNKTWQLIHMLRDMGFEVELKTMREANARTGK